MTEHIVEQGYAASDIPISSICISNRYRKDHGNIELLASSIEQLGLLQPIGITSDRALVFGHRRLLAFQHLGRTTIPARIIDLPSLVLAEHAENEIRKDFTFSERVAIGEAVEAELGKRQGQRTDLKVNEGQETLGGLSPRGDEVSGRTDDIAAQKAGFESRRSYRDAKAVVDKAAPELVAAMDAGTVAVSTAAKLAQAPVEVQRAAAVDPKQAIELAKKASAEKIKQTREVARVDKSTKTAERRAERIERIAEISQGNAEMDTSIRYPVIYADPPWRYEHCESDSREIENHYPTMLLNEICALPVMDIATDDAILFLWATSPKLAESMRVIESWGFIYRTCAVWDKQHIGMGYYFRQQHELLLVATKGSIPAPPPYSRPASIYSERRGKHSAKPSRFAEWIEAMYPELNKIELFCREPRKGWFVWGNQS